MAKTTQEQPSRNEDEFFAKQDAELLKQLRAKQDKERAANERKAHYMKCPKCGADLKEIEQGHARIDVCPECGGMWLDAGELEILKTAQKAGANVFKGVFEFVAGGSKKK